MLKDVKIKLTQSFPNLQYLTSHIYFPITDCYTGPGSLPLHALYCTPAVHLWIVTLHDVKTTRPVLPTYNNQQVKTCALHSTPTVHLWIVTLHDVKTTRSVLPTYNNQQDKTCAYELDLEKNCLFLVRYGKKWVIKKNISIIFLFKKCLFHVTVQKKKRVDWSLKKFS